MSLGGVGGTELHVYGPRSSSVGAQALPRGAAGCHGATAIGGSDSALASGPDQGKAKGHKSHERGSQGEKGAPRPAESGRRQ